MFAELKCCMSEYMKVHTSNLSLFTAWPPSAEVQYLKKSIHLRNGRALSDVMDDGRLVIPNANDARVSATMPDSFFLVRSGPSCSAYELDEALKIVWRLSSRRF